MNQDLPEHNSLKILVIDDHELVLDGTINVLQRQYPEAKIVTTQTAEAAQEQVKTSQPDLVVMDLSVPEKVGAAAQTDTGIQLLKTLMKNYPTPG